MATESGESGQDDRAAFFECNVCLDVAKEPVVSLVSSVVVLVTTCITKYF